MVTGQRERLFFLDAENYPYFPFLVCLSVWETARGCFPRFLFFALSRPLSQNGMERERPNLQKWAVLGLLLFFSFLVVCPKKHEYFLPQPRLETASSCFPRGPHDENQTEIHTFHLFKCVNVFDTFPRKRDRIENKFHSCFCFLAFCMGDIECVLVEKEKFRETLLSLRRTCSSSVCICVSLSHPPDPSRRKRIAYGFFAKIYIPFK